MTTTETFSTSDPSNKRIPDQVNPDETHSSASTGSASTLSAAPTRRELLEGVDPNELIIGANTRTEIALDKNFVADIRDRGVREIITVRRNTDGKLVVRKGQLRTLAAIEAGRLVDVVVEPELLTDETEQEIDRIFDQLAENEHRSGISDADEVRATQQLLDLGVAARQIARKRHVPVDRVKTAAAVAGTQVAIDALTAGTFDLSQAAVVAEFADDEAAVEKLTTAALKRPEQFPHIAQRLRDDRQEERLRAELTAQLTEQGVKVVDRPEGLYSGKARELDRLRRNPQTEPGTEFTTAEHSECPGHAAWIDYRAWKPEAERAQATFICTDFQRHGHAERHTRVGVVTSGKVTGPMTEAQKAERRTVIANNKAWVSAEKVRREWLANFLKRKTPPKNAERWITQTLARGSHDVRKTMESNHSLAIELLGLNKRAGGKHGQSAEHAIAAAAAKASPGRATMLTVGMLLAGLENGTDRTTWRQPSREAKAYFQQLQAWDYPISDVEGLVIQPSSEDINASTADHDTDAEPSSADDEEDVDSLTGNPTVTPGDAKDVIEPGSGTDQPSRSDAIDPDLAA